MFFPDATLDDTKIRMKGCVQKNVFVRKGGTISLHSCEDIPYGLSVHVQPFDDTVEANLMEDYLKPYFEESNRPCRQGNTFLVRHREHREHAVEFKIIRVDPGEVVTCGPETVIHCEAEPMKREDERRLEPVIYDHVIVSKQFMAQIKEMIESPIKGVKPSRGVLLHGPRGCGKALVAQAAANETWAFFVSINCREIMSRGSGEVESSLRSAFGEAEKNSPAIIFIDEIDSISSTCDESRSQIGQHITSLMVTLMDGAKAMSQVVVIGATTRRDAVHASLRESGRLDYDLEMQAPDEDIRVQLLRALTRYIVLDISIRLDDLASMTSGFVGADMAQLCMGAACCAGATPVTEDHFISAMAKCDPPIFDMWLQELREKGVKFANITWHLIPPTTRCSPAAQTTLRILHQELRDRGVEIPKIRWHAIAGSDNTKRAVQELFYEEDKSRSCLLYGPPGCGKTMLAKASAYEGSRLFVSINCAELLAGDAEANVKELLEIVHAVSPCTLFCNEVDSIGNSDTSSALEQLMAGLDQLELKVNCIFATERPSVLDPDLALRKFRGNIVYVPLPGARARRGILGSLLSKVRFALGMKLSSMTRQTEGLTVAELLALCQSIAATQTLCTQDCFEAALTNVHSTSDFVIVCNHVEVEGHIVCTKLNGGSIGLFPVPPGIEPLGSWLADEITKVFPQKRGRLRLISQAGEIFWSQPDEFTLAEYELFCKTWSPALLPDRLLDEGGNDSDTAEFTIVDGVLKERDRDSDDDLYS